MKIRRKLLQEEMLQATLEKYPFLKNVNSKRMIIKYGKAIEKYPDLKNLTVKLAIIAYDFREEQLSEYKSQQMGELANARCNVQINKVGFESSIKISDLPAFSFDKECIVCWQEKKCLSICPTCWQILRKCLDLKGKSHREGWEGWGKEMALDLSNIVRLLKNNEHGRELLRQAIEEQSSKK